MLHELQVNRRMHRRIAFLATHRAAAQAAAAAQATTEDAVSAVNAVVGTESAESAVSGSPAWGPRHVLDTAPSVSDGMPRERGRGYRRRGVVFGQRRRHCRHTAGTHAVHRCAAKVCGDLLK